jgi:hypothetical protein
VPGALTNFARDPRTFALLRSRTEVSPPVTMHAFLTTSNYIRIGRLWLNSTVRWLDRYVVERCEIQVTHTLTAIPKGGRFHHIALATNQRLG